MKFTYFKFENFKGIEKGILDLSKNPKSNIFTLVGLNESGKTTILEAINYFAHKPEKLDGLNLDKYEVDDIHNLIPVNKRDNFNGKILIEASVELEDDEINEIITELKDNGVTVVHFGKYVTFTQEYFFEDSKHVKNKNNFVWSYNINERKKNAKKDTRLNITSANNIVNKYITKNIPNILYFPNFLFEFPERINLNSDIDDKKHKFYQKIIQDILDSLGNNANIQDHLISRIISTDETDKRNLRSLIGKMERKLTDVIFKKWNQILNKEITETEVILYTGVDEIHGPYIEFNIKHNVDTYRIIERSLGFRWFFVYILLTQFRTFRKTKSEAFFLFDEPASNLHPSAQSELLKSFEKLPNVIYTTHSHYLINPKWLENTFVIKNQALDYDKEEVFDAKNTNVTIHKYREFAVNYPNQSNYFQPILEVLDYKPSDLELVPKVVFTEGKNDFYTLKYFHEIILEKNEKLNIVPGASASNLEELISLYLGWGAKFIILLDSDKEGVKQKARYTEIFGLAITELIYTYEDVKSSWKNIKMEKLFDDNDKNNIVVSVYESDKEVSKSILNRSIQELYMFKKKLIFSEDTQSNFVLLIEFLEEKLRTL